MLRERWQVALLIAAGILALAYNVRTYSTLWREPKLENGSSTASLPEDEASDEEPAKPAATLSDRAVTELVAGLPVAARDPFRFAETRTEETAASGGPPALVLQGTLVGRRRVAWINQRARCEGEDIDGQVIERIEANHVVMRRGTEEYEIWPSR